MTSALYAVDEEADAGAYRAYLRAQSNDDLLDIARNLDSERYPARLDAALREARRRLVVQTPLYSTAENVVRHIAVAAFILAGLLLLLRVLAGPRDVAGLAGPAESLITEGMPVSEIMRLFLIDFLRTVMVGAAHCGMFVLVAGWLTYWLATRCFLLVVHRARADVWRLCFVAWISLAGGLMVAALPGSAVPALAGQTSGVMRMLWPLNPVAQTDCR